MSYLGHNCVVGYGWWRGLVLAYLWLALRPFCRLFCRHILATISLVDQGCHCLSLNAMLRGN